MIIFECAWCERQLPIDGPETTSVDCPDCVVSVDLEPVVLPDLAAAA